VAFVDPNLFSVDETEQINSTILKGKFTGMDIQDIAQQEISEWDGSERKKWMETGERYYRNKTEIRERERKAVGASGALEPVANLANNRLANAFVRKLVDQKVGYLLGKPLSIQTDNKKYLKELNAIFDKSMLRRLQSICKEAINKGIAWMHVYYDGEGKLSFKKMRSEEIIPIWADEAHTILEAVIRVYSVDVYDGKNKTTVKKVEWWAPNGVWRFVYDGNGFNPDIEAGEYSTHFAVEVNGESTPLNFGEVPFIAFKYNEEEQPLVEIIKELVDDYDRNKSDVSNNLEDLPNSIYVVKGYDGTKPEDFRKNISTYRVVFVDGTDGSGVESVNIEIDTEAYKAHQELNRKDIFEFGRGVLYDPGKTGNSPSGAALRFLYADLDMDANMIETEFQASLERWTWCIDFHLFNTTKADYSAETVEFIFNRDIIISESEVIEDINKSVGLLSKKTLRAQHPYVTDPQVEEERIAEEEKQETERYGDPYARLGQEVTSDEIS